MMNRVVLVGRLTKDPELKYTPSGVAVANFTLAVNRSFTNQSGEREADFINVVVWRRAAENVANFLRKGSMVGVDGRIQTRNFEAQDGRRVFTTEVVAESVQFLEPKPKDAPQGNGGGGGQSSRPYQNQNQNRSNSYNQQQQQQQQQQNHSPSYLEEDPFANDNGGPINISDDDLPF